MHRCRQTIRTDDARDSGVGGHGAEPRLPAAAHQAHRQPMLQKEQVGGADAEHDDRVPVQAIPEPAPSRQRQILAHGERVDVADAALIEVARTRVVDRVRAAPEIVRCQCQDAQDAAHPIIRQPMAKKGTMAAIMLNHEQAYQQARSRHRQQQTEPVAEIQRGPHQDPQQNQWHDRDDELGHTASAAGFAVACKNSRPGQHVGRRGGSAGMFRIFQCRIHLSCELVEALTALYRGRVPKLGDPKAGHRGTFSLRHFFPSCARLMHRSFTSTQGVWRQSALRAQSKRRQVVKPVRPR